MRRLLSSNLRSTEWSREFQGADSESGEKGCSQAEKSTGWNDVGWTSERESEDAGDDERVLLAVVDDIAEERR